MAETIEITCAKCDKQMTVPGKLAGKKIRCKGCEAVVAVPDPAAKETFKLAEEPKAEKKPKPKPKKEVVLSPQEAEPPEEEDANPYGVTADDSHIARCPFCAKEIDPPDARICRHCGFDMLERRRNETKNVFELTFGDWMSHHAITIGAAIFIIVMITLATICVINMPEWFEGSWFEQDEKDLTTGKKKYIVGPGIGQLWSVIVSLFLIWYAGKFIYKQCRYNWRPTEMRTGN